MHRTNAAEKAIQTRKNHFLAGLASLPAEFPINFWCSLIPQANITLNLLQPCCINPALSAQTAMHGEFHFESTPMAPPGTKALIHIKPNKRASWGFHADNAWYIKVLMHKTAAQRITDTVCFQHHAVQIPQITPAERIEKATKALTDAVRNVPVEAPPDYVT
eukprot:1430359-Ditylum_brightwellii.AAC.1